MTQPVTVQEATKNDDGTTTIIASDGRRFGLPEGHLLANQLIGWWVDEDNNGFFAYSPLGEQQDLLIYID